ncbi:MAG: pyridoxamine 5'-phosphate oxidase family protein [Ardenticatenaceae bacterium]|nr:pyridoxamine 5'-phosphate oxidase family protein [Ardenticatenaceae bacterium]MCB9443735.1 pyridoxamine 5'-phosphate oxidase family protein [Ardenticatenaceae bacterium]
MPDPRQSALAYLQQHRVMSLATSDPDGVWTAAVFYVNDGFDLYFLSAGHTRHARGIAFEPRIAATIQEDYADWKMIQGIQLAGVATQLFGAERLKAIALYRSKFTFLAQATAVIQAAFEKVNWYRLRPYQLYFVDNSRGFGHRDEIELD